MMPMLVVKKIMSTIKQLGKWDNVHQRPFDIIELSKNNNSKNIIINVFHIYLHHNPIKV
jgi:Na+-transporting NADH:ubiquinone oxidoreductase subunit NqrA